MKRKRNVGYSSSSAARRPFKAPRRAYSSLTLAQGPLRTGGNFNQILARPYNGSYRTGPGPEKKFNDFNNFISIPFLAIGAGSGSDSGTPPAPVLLNGLGQGTDANTRLGRKVTMTAIHGRITVSSQLTATGLQPAGLVGGRVRLMIVYDTQTNGAAAVATDILQAATVQSCIAPMNLNNRERFKVLLDKVQAIGPNGPDTAYFKFFKKCNLPVIFNAGNAGTVADIQTGAIWLLMATNIQATGASTADSNIYTRIRFIDD